MAGSGFSEVVPVSGVAQGGLNVEPSRKVRPAATSVVLLPCPTRLPTAILPSTAAG